ncbi:MAG: BatA domain-containing protein [Planctomycetales bacterium]|nr:BatA domain-containing protein [Planctomycetales bacterium]
MQFVFQALTWGFLLTLLPLLIHLINMLRHKRVKWAAMDFLLKSYKKHRRWVWLKQLLLLLMRMAAIALIVAMLAQWDPRGSWLSALGGQVTHHYVLLDDSYSMSERQGAGTVFDDAIKAVARIGSEASEHTNQRFTLLRFSRAATAPESDEVADLSSEIVDSEFGTRLEETTRGLATSALAAGPRPALEMLRKMLNEGRSEKNYCYLISDFRAGTWEQPTEVRDLLQEVERDAKVHLISAAPTGQGNLSIEAVRPDGSTRAAGVPLFVDVMVRNHSTTEVNRIEVSASTIAMDEDDEATATPGELKGKEDDLPVEVIDTIAAGGVGVARFQVAYNAVGRHVFKATLPSDNVPADNERFVVLGLESGEPVLAIDDRPEFGNGDYWMKILQPGGQSNTGLRPEVQPTTFLRDATVADLRRFSGIYLFGSTNLDEAMVRKLEQYVSGGGGLAIFMSPGIALDQYNTLLFKDGEGVMPLPLGRAWTLSFPLEEGAPDIDITGTNHDVFRDLLRGRNPIIRMVRVEQYVEPPSGWEVAAENKVDVIARLHNGMPLAAEKRFGNGRVFQFMTTYSPIWNDLVITPNVLMTLNLQAYLASTRRVQEDRLVGSPLRVEFNGETAEPKVQFVAPTAKSPIVVERQAQQASSDSTLVAADLGMPTESPGVYEAWIEDLDGKLSARRFALNVDPNEGDLRVVDSELMLNELRPAKPTFQYVDEMYGIVNESGFNPSLWIMGLLVLLLLGEQMLAYVLSYHPPRGASR